MILAGIFGQSGITETAEIINSFSSLTEKKISIIDSAILTELSISTLRDYVRELEKNGIEILVLKINFQDVSKNTFSFLHFDIIIYTNKSNNVKNELNKKFSEIIFKVLSQLDKKGIVIINIDDTDLISFLNGMECHIVTYGFNKKASITASSIGDAGFKDNFMCCLQRTISTKYGQLVEPQEYIIKVEIENSDPYNILAAAAFAIVNGIDLNILSCENVK